MRYKTVTDLKKMAIKILFIYLFTKTGKKTTLK